MRVSTFGFLVFASSVPALAQCPRAELAVGTSGGAAVALEGSLLAVGAPVAAGAGSQDGAVFLFDSSTGVPLGIIVDPSGNTDPVSFGRALDLDGGVLAVGAPQAMNGGLSTGTVYLFAVPSGALLHTIAPPAGRQGDGFGVAVALDGGRLVVGAPNEDVVAQNSGAAHVYDVATGQWLFDLSGSTASTNDLFGWSVAIHGARVLVGAPADEDLGTGTGSAHLFDATTGQALATWTSGDLSARLLGSAVALDGTRAVLGRKRGGVRVRDLATGQETLAIDVPFVGSDLSAEVAAISIDGDLALVGLPYDKLAGGSGHLVDLASGGVFDSLYRSGKEAGWFGFAVDFDAGRFAIGAVLDETATVYDLCGPVGASYCGPAVPNSTGSPALLGAAGSDVASENDFSLRAESLPPARKTLLLASLTQGSIPNVGGGQGRLCVGGPFARFIGEIGKSTGAGTFVRKLDLSAIPLGPPVAVMAGETWNFQAWYRDANPTATSNLTNGVSVLFQ